MGESHCPGLLKPETQGWLDQQPALCISFLSLFEVQLFLRSESLSVKSRRHRELHPHRSILPSRPVGDALFGGTGPSLGLCGSHPRDPARHTKLVSAFSLASAALCCTPQLLSLRPLLVFKTLGEDSVVFGRAAPALLSKGCHSHRTCCDELSSRSTTTLWGARPRWAWAAVGKSLR